MHLLSKTTWWVMEYKLINADHKLIDAGINAAKIVVNNFSYNELVDWVKGSHPEFPVARVYFSSVTSRFEDYYFTVEETRKWVDDLLNFQFNGCVEFINQFLIALYNVVTGVNDKKNVLEIVSPPSAYKSTFVTMIADAMINTGYCNKNNRYERFGFQDISNVRLAIIDDPNFDEAARDTLLCLFSGDKVNIARKNMSDDVLLKTPFIVLSNKNMFPGKKWDDRMERFVWKRWDVKKGQKKFNPYYTYELFDYVKNVLLTVE